MIPVVRPAPIRYRDFQAFRELIRREAGIQLSDAKQEMVASRLARRLRALGYFRYQDYLEHLRRADPAGQELREMVNCLTTNKTGFFRELHHFDFLVREVLRREGTFCFWSAGCSTGEEAYSLAMTAREALGDAALERVRILATDIDTRVLEQARAGSYEAARLDPVPPTLRRRHFLTEPGPGPERYRVHPDTAALVRFQHLNLAAEDWPATGRFDVIACRNVIIYLGPEIRARLVHRFAERLLHGGHLFLGHAEALSGDQRLFQPLGQTIFRLRARVSGAHTPPAQGPADPGPGRPPDAGRREPASERRITAGELHVGTGDERVRTLLGSCVAACLYDPEAGVGGMNHFMLPQGPAGGMPARYGVHAMEMLINGIMRAGGERRRLRAKVFGAASVLELGGDAPDVAQANQRFIRDFLATEGIPLVAERLGGCRPLDVRMLVGTGRVFVRSVTPERAQDAALEERLYRGALGERAPSPADITLF